MSEKWTGWDLDKPPVENAIATRRGWEIPLKGTNPDDGLTEVIVSIRNLSGRDSIPPLILLVSTPDDGANLVTGDILNIKVTFDEAVTVTGTPSINVFANDGVTPLANVSASYVAGSGSNVLEFQYTVDATDVEATGVMVGADIQLNGGSIVDITNANADVTFAQTLLNVTLN